MAPAQPAHRQPAAPPRPVLADRLQRVRRAGRVVPADVAVQRADRRAVGPKQPDHDRPHEFVPEVPSRRSRQPDRSAPNRRESTSAAAGNARTTTIAAAGRLGSRSSIRCRSRRRIRFRATADPQARLTTKPTRGGGGAGCADAASSDPTAGRARWTTSVAEPARRPRRVATAKSRRCRRREVAGSTITVLEVSSAGSGRALVSMASGRQARGRQAASRSRPLRRRAARIARPARVRIRRRKPCVLCRRRLFGWKVLLLTVAPVLSAMLGVLDLRRSSGRPTGTTDGRAPAGRARGPRACGVRGLVAGVGPHHGTRTGRTGSNLRAARTPGRRIPAERAVHNCLLRFTRRCYRPDLLPFGSHRLLTGCGQLCGRARQSPVTARRNRDKPPRRLDDRRGPAQR